MHDGDKWEDVMNLKPSLKLGGQLVVLVFTIQMSALLLSLAFVRC